MSKRDRRVEIKMTGAEHRTIASAATRAHLSLGTWVRARALDAAQRQGGTMHTRDEDCTVGKDGCCTVCGVSHTAECDCGGRGFHRPGCPEIEPTTPTGPCMVKGCKGTGPVCRHCGGAVCDAHGKSGTACCDGEGNAY